jgi:SAM-dependent methyltransferase
VNAVDQLHQNYVLSRRVRVLGEHLAKLLPPGASVLDVGSGDGLLAAELLRKRSDIQVQGVDVHVRTTAAIPVASFDGRTLPFGDSSFDAVVLVDVLHHADDPARLLREAARVARGPILIKDHTCDRFLAIPTLRFMDRVGNARHGVSLPYRYWRRQTWLDNFRALGLEITFWENDLGLYPIPARWLFGGSLHFLARVAAN